MTISWKNNAPRLRSASNTACASEVSSDVSASAATRHSAACSRSISAIGELLSGALPPFPSASAGPTPRGPERHSVSIWLASYSRTRAGSTCFPTRRRQLRSHRAAQSPRQDRPRPAPALRHHVLPVQQETHEIRRGHRLDLRAQAVQSVAMDARKQRRSHHSSGASAPVTGEKYPRSTRPSASSASKAPSINSLPDRLRSSASCCAVTGPEHIEAAAHELASRVFDASTPCAGARESPADWLRHHRAEFVEPLDRQPETFASNARPSGDERVEQRGPWASSASARRGG